MHGAPMTAPGVARGCLQDNTTDCARLFAANGDRQNTTLNREWCEENTAGWVVANMLPQVGLVGTPEDPKTLQPRVTPPPPPSPPPPSPPPPPPPARAPDVLVGMIDSGAMRVNTAVGFVSLAALVCAGSLTAAMSFS